MLDSLRNCSKKTYYQPVQLCPSIFRTYPELQEHWQVNNILIYLLSVLVNVKLHSSRCLEYMLKVVGVSVFCLLSG